MFASRSSGDHAACARGARWTAMCSTLLAACTLGACAPSSSGPVPQPTSPITAQLLVVLNRTEMAVVFGYAPPVPACATRTLTRRQLTTPNDLPVPPDAWPAPVQVIAGPGTGVITALVTSSGVVVSEGRIDESSVPPCRGRPPGA